MERPEDFDFISRAPKYDLTKLGVDVVQPLRRVLVVGLGGGCDVFAAYALANVIARSNPEATVLYASAKSNCRSGSEELLGFSQVEECLWSALAEAAPLAYDDRHGTAPERSCPRGPEGSPLLLVLPGSGGGLAGEGVGAVVRALASVGVDLVVGVDCGGRSLIGGQGGDVLRCVGASGVPAVHVVLGPGCDGEGEEPAVRARCAALAAGGSLRGVFPVQPLFEDMLGRCSTKALQADCAPMLVWRAARAGELSSAGKRWSRKSPPGDYVSISRGGRSTRVPREWLLHGLVIRHDGAAKASRGAASQFVMPSLFVSGGQVGADSIPFTVYEDLGVKLDGYMPKGFARSDGNGAQIAARHGLREGQGGHKWRDCKNVDLADAVCAFLTSKPMTGRGTMQTCAYAADGKYKHVQLDKPSDSDFMMLEPSGAGKPVVVFWDVADSKVDACASILRQFLEHHGPRALMFSGPLEDTLPGIERVGARILRRALESS